MAATELSSRTSTSVKDQASASPASSGRSSPGVMSAPRTRAPSCSNRAAVARPIPDAAPVTTMFLPVQPPHAVSLAVAGTMPQASPVVVIAPVP